MIRKKVDGSLERQFLTALIVSKQFLSGAAPMMDIQLLQSKLSQQIAGWCLEHFKQYHDAPGRNIEARYHGWVENTKPESADAEQVHDFLEAISAEHDSAQAFNVPHLLDELSNYLTLRKITQLHDALGGALTSGEREQALTAIQSFRTVRSDGGGGWNPLRNREVLKRAFAAPLTPLVAMPGAAGHFFDKAFLRDSLIGIQGPEKRGKTWWCLEFMYRTLRAGKRAAMFQVGDLSEEQLEMRMSVRIANVPMWRDECAGVNMPSGITVVRTQDGLKAEVQNVIKTFPVPIDYKLAKASRKQFEKTHRLTGDVPYVMFSVHSNGSINVAGIHGILERWKQELGFVADVIVIDYADILSPESMKREPRDQIDETWRRLRRLSQEWHACVIAPTQANAASYKTKTQSMGNFSGNKLKNAHVTGMLGLNQTEEEKKQQVMRLNWLALRGAMFNTSECLYVAQCLPLGMALVKSAR